MKTPVTYLHLQPGAIPPPRDSKPPFRAVLVAEVGTSSHWQAEVSDWLTRSGCLYAPAAGTACSAWERSIDEANIEQFHFGEIPEDSFVMTTCHDGEPLSEVFWFAKYNAFHPTVELLDTVLIHVSMLPRSTELLQAYAAA
jgi:hypothetical protein